MATFNISQMGLKNTYLLGGNEGDDGGEPQGRVEDEQQGPGGGLGHVGDGGFDQLQTDVRLSAGCRCLKRCITKIS